LDGTTVHLEAVGGVIETRDEEIARALDAMSTLARIARAA
jgi:hypothetical protein